MAKRVHWSKDVSNLDWIERAVSYTAHFRKGPFETYTVPATSLSDARNHADTLTKEHGAYGRRAAVYAITADGFTALVPSHYSPSA